MLTAPKNNRGQWSETRPIIMYIPRAQRTVLRQINKSISGILPSQSERERNYTQEGYPQMTLQYSSHYFHKFVLNLSSKSMRIGKSFANDELDYCTTNQQVNFWSMWREIASRSASINGSHWTISFIHSRIFCNSSFSFMLLSYVRNSQLTFLWSSLWLSLLGNVKLRFSI